VVLAHRYAPASNASVSQFMDFFRVACAAVALLLLLLLLPY